MHLEDSLYDKSKLEENYGTKDQVCEQTDVRCTTFQMINCFAKDVVLLLIFIILAI